MVGMPGLEPGNPEGADLQSAAVAAVPHPHSVFKLLWKGRPFQAEEILRRGKLIVNVYHATGRIPLIFPAQLQVKRLVRETLFLTGLTKSAKSRKKDLAR